MERFPRGTLPPSAFRAIATVAPHAVVVKSELVMETVAPIEQAEQVRQPQCDLTTTCPTCMVEMQPEHAHYKCPSCGYRDSCCF